MARFGQAILALAVALVLAPVLGSWDSAPAEASVLPPSATTLEQVEAKVAPSLVYEVITATGTVTVPYSTITTNGNVINYAIYTNFSTQVYCSGSIISSGTAAYVLSAGHCFDPDYADFSAGLISSVYAYLQQNPPTTFTVTITEAQADQAWTVSSVSLSVTVYATADAASVGQAKPYKATIVADTPPWPGPDVALAKIDQEVALPSLSVASSAPDSGENVIAIGYPAAVTQVVDGADLQPTFNTGNVSSSQTVDGHPYTEISAALAPGMSGGPTVNDAGQVIGTNSFDLTGTSQPFNFVTGTSTIQSLLNDSNVPLTPDAETAAWRTGLDDYFAGRFRQAAQQLSLVLRIDPGFVAARQYLAQAQGGEAPQAVPSHGQGSKWPTAIAIAGVLAITVLALAWRRRAVRPRQWRGSRVL